MYTNITSRALILHSKSLETYMHACAPKCLNMTLLMLCVLGKGNWKTGSRGERKVYFSLDSLLLL